MIEVILLERIERLGHLGDKVRVRPGFARNFLLPQKKALRATENNIALFASRKAEIEAQNKSKREAADKTGAKLNGKKFVIIRQAGETGQLFGSVNARDIAEAATSGGFEVERHMVAIDQPVKTLGLFPIRIRLHPETSVTVTINVARSTEEAVLQESRGGMVIKTEEEPETKAADVNAQLFDDPRTSSEPETL